MNSSSNSSEFRDFLLDRLPPERAEAIEERMFQDEAYFSDIQDAEDELIEEYVMEALDPAETQLFTARVQRDSNLRDRVTVRRALIRTLQQSAPEEVAAASARQDRSHRRMWNRFLVPGFALAILILFFLSYKAEHRHGLPANAPETASAPSGTQSTTQAAVVLFLPAHVARGAEQHPSVLHLGSAGLVKLELETPSAPVAARWTVRITDATGTAFSTDDLKPLQAGVVPYVVAAVPASQLPPGMYAVTLSPPSTTSGASLSWDLRVVQ